MNKRVLLIDDDPSVHEVARSYLEHDGYVVYSASEGREGLNLCAIRHPSVLVLDLMLPDLDGVQVLQELRRRSKIRVLMLSARDGVEERVEGPLPRRRRLPRQALQPT